MLNWFNKLSLRIKLLIVIQTVSAITLIAGLLFELKSTNKIIKDETISSLRTISKLIAEICSLPLHFEDRLDLQLQLNRIKSISEIKYVCVWDKNGKLFYEENLSEKKYKTPAIFKDTTFRLTDDLLEIIEPIYVNSKTIGHLYLRTSVALSLKNQNLIINLSILFCVLTLLSLLLSNKLQRIVLQPIRKLAAFTRYVGSSKNYKARLQVSSSDEFGQVKQDFNNMLETIDYYVQELERNNKDLEEFNYVASHDLKEPLRTISRYCDLLKSDLPANLPKDAEDDIRFISDAALRLDMLVSDLLELSRTGRKELITKKLNLSESLKNAMDNLNAMIEDTNAKITYNIDITVSIDAVLITNLFQNLINNAIKFQHNKIPEITIKHKISENIVTISVADNGIGIEPQYRDLIFVPFKRLHSFAKYKGSGIGLAICKKIIEKHGGKIWVESEYGNGSIFYFTLPFNV